MLIESQGNNMIDQRVTQELQPLVVTAASAAVGQGQPEQLLILKLIADP